MLVWSICLGMVNLFSYADTLTKCERVHTHTNTDKVYTEEETSAQQNRSSLGRASVRGQLHSNMQKDDVLIACDLVQISQTGLWSSAQHMDQNQRFINPTKLKKKKKIPSLPLEHYLNYHSSKSMISGVTDKSWLAFCGT